MKLRNKKTGEMGNLVLNINPNRESYSVLSTENGDTACGNLVLADYNSLADLNAEWEDEPEETEYYWYIDINGQVKQMKYFGFVWQNRMTEIGNRFETEEEAEKAVEKLKAWQRLKDTGCKPITWRWKQDYPIDACYVEVVLKCQFDSGVHDKELDLLFGGEE